VLGDDNGTASQVMACVDCNSCNDIDYDCEAQFKDEDFDEWGDAIACQTQEIPNDVRCTADGDCMSGLCECTDAQCSILRCQDSTPGGCNVCGYASPGTDTPYDCYRLEADAEHAIHCHTDSACDGVNYEAANCQTKNGYGCTTAGDCLSGNCECANNDCSDKACAANPCPSCKFINDAQGNCNGALNNDLSDPVNSCGTETCNGQGACHLADAEGCNTHEECASNFCECADLTCSAKKCSPQACGCHFNADGDTSCEASLTNGKEVVGQCEDTSACYSGACKLKTDQACSDDDDCGSGYCECMANDCGNVPPARQCQDTDCGPCGYFDTASATCSPLAAGQSHPEDCRAIDYRICDGMSEGQNGCKIMPGQGTCADDSECITSNCAFGRCCAQDCNDSCETCVENDGSTCTAAPFDNTATNPCAGDGYICDGNNAACTTSCTEDVECAAEYLCEKVAGECVPEQNWTVLGPDLNDYNFTCVNCGATMYNDGAHPQLILNSELPVLAYDIQANSTDTKRALVFEWNDVIGSDPDNYWTKPQNDDLSQCTASVNLGENCDVSTGTCCQNGTSCESGTCQLLCICRDNGSCDHDGSCSVGAQGTNQPQAYEPTLANTTAGFFYSYRAKDAGEHHKIMIYHSTYTGSTYSDNTLVDLPPNDLDKYLSGPGLALSWTADAGGTSVQSPVAAWFFGADAGLTKTLNVKHRIYGDDDSNPETPEKWYWIENADCSTGAGSASGQGLGQSSSTHPPAISYNADGEVLLAWIDATDGYVHLSQFEDPGDGWCWKPIGAMNSANSADPSVAYGTSGTNFIQTIAYTDTSTNTIDVTYYYQSGSSWAQLGAQTPAQVINQPGWTYSKPKLRRDVRNDEGAILAFIAKGAVGDATSETRQAYMLYYHPTENKWLEITATPRSISGRGLGYDTTTQEVCDLDVATSAEQICLTTQEQAQGEDCDGSTTTHVYVQCLPWGALP
jgi:hypothetical protein